MKKIYFSVIFSVVLFLLFPVIKAEASDFFTTKYSHISPEGRKYNISYSYQSNPIKYVFSFQLSNGKDYIAFVSDKPTDFSWTSFMGTSNSELYSSMNGYSYYGYYCFCSSLPSLSPIDFIADDTIKNEYHFLSNFCKKLSGGEDPFYVAPTYTPDFSGLGYLKGLGKYYKEQTVASQSTNLFGIKRYVISDRKYIFGWDPESTSGVQLSDENISVNVKVQLFGNRSTLSGETVPIKCNGTIVDFGNVPASAFYYSTSLAEFLVKFDFSDTNDLNGDKKPIFYFRLEKKNDDNTVTYGNTLKFDPSAPISYISDSVSSSPEGTITVGDLTDSGFVVDGSIESETVTGQGISGSSWEEVTINSNMNFVQDNSMITNIESFLSQIGSIPRIVGILFSFLPSWCIGFVGLGLGMLVTVLVIKVVRG